MKENFRVTVLQKIFSEFQQITQWLPSNLAFAAESMNKATSLIELLEADDCGSHGGHDPKNPIKRESGFELFDRFMAVTRKYENEKDIKNVCGFDLQKMQKFFNTLSKLREHSIKGE